MSSSNFDVDTYIVRENVSILRSAMSVIEKEYEKLNELLTVTINSAWSGVAKDSYCNSNAVVLSFIRETIEDLNDINDCIENSMDEYDNGDISVKDIIELIKI